MVVDRARGECNVDRAVVVAPEGLLAAAEMVRGDEAMLEEDAVCEEEPFVGDCCCKVEGALKAARKLAKKGRCSCCVGIIWEEVDGG